MSPVDPPEPSDPEQQELDIKCQFTALQETLMLIPKGRPRAIALTKLEECLLWAAVALRGKQNAFDVVGVAGEGDE